LPTRGVEETPEECKRFNIEIFDRAKALDWLNNMPRGRKYKKIGISIIFAELQLTYGESSIK
jgi:hypothetical protein